MISFVWAKARRTPGIAPHAAPHAAPATIIAGTISHADVPARTSAISGRADRTEVELAFGADVEQPHPERHRGSEARERERCRRDEGIRECPVVEEGGVEQASERRDRRMARREEHDGDREERDDEGAGRDDDREPAALDEPTLDAERRQGHPHACHQEPDLVDSRDARVDLADEPALVHHDDPICQGQDLVEILTDQEHGDAVRRRVAQEPMDGLDRADVQAARRRGDHERLRPARELPREDDLLQVAAREHPRRDLGAGRAPDVIAPDHLDGTVADPSQSQERAARQRPRRCRT